MRFDWSTHHFAGIYRNSDWLCAQWLLVVLVSNSHLSALLSLIFCSTVEIRWVTEWVSGFELWPFDLQMAGIVTAIFRVRSQTRLSFVPSLS